MPEYQNDPDCASDPVFMGGKKNQTLTPMKTAQHQQLHRDLNNFLVTQTNAADRHMRPQSNNSGKTIRDNFSPAERRGAMGAFYSGIGKRFKAAARDFFNQPR